VRKSRYSIQNQLFLAMLRSCRQRRRLRQADVARKLGGTQATVSKVESGERRLDIIELRAWLAAIGVDFVLFVAELDDRIRGSAAMEGSVFPRDAPADAPPDPGPAEEP
jgi:transcriptional regulator with XRE-family HTH domain